MKKTKTIAKKITKPIIHLEESAKYSSWQEALEQADFIRATDDHEWRRRLIDLFYKWANQDDSLELQQFLWTYKIPVQTFYQWVAKYPDIKEAHQNIRNHIGARRRLGAMTNKLNYQAAYRDMHLLAYKWAEEVDDYHANLKAKTEGGLLGGIRVVEIEKYPDSPLVPHKKEQNE